MTLYATFISLFQISAENIPFPVQLSKRAVCATKRQQQEFLSVLERVSEKLAITGCFFLHLQQLQKMYQVKIPSDFRQWANYLSSSRQAND